MIVAVVTDGDHVVAPVATTPSPVPVVSAVPAQPVAVAAPAEPPTLAVVRIGGGGGGASSMTQLTDVDLSGGVADGTVLLYDAASETWKPGLSPDQKNFKGDWQDPSDTLLWSTDFSDPADLALLTPSTFGSTTGSPAVTRAAMASLATTSNPGFAWVAVLSGASTSSASVNAGEAMMLNLASVLPAGAVLRRSKAWMATSVVTAGVNKRMVTTAAVGSGVGSASNTVWAAHVLTGTITGLGFSMEDTSTGAAIQATAALYVAGLELYGSPSADDLYQRDDVVLHGGSYWRSLYDDNDVEPLVGGTHWLQIPAL